MEAINKELDTANVLYKMTLASKNKAIGERDTLIKIYEGELIDNEKIINNLNNKVSKYKNITYISTIIIILETILLLSR